MTKTYEWYRLAIAYEDGSWEEVGHDCFDTFEDANEERIYLQPDYEDKIVIFKETRQIVT